VVFVFIILSFVISFGYFFDNMSGGSKSYAAKVDRTTISLEQYQNSYQRLRDIYQQLFGQAGGLTPELENNSTSVRSHWTV